MYYLYSWKDSGSNALNLQENLYWRKLISFELGWILLGFFLYLFIIDFFPKWPYTKCCLILHLRITEETVYKSNSGKISMYSMLAFPGANRLKQRSNIWTCSKNYEMQYNFTFKFNTPNETIMHVLDYMLLSLTFFKQFTLYYM